jgi:putative cell wall-binding protein
MKIPIAVLAVLVLAAAGAAHEEDASTAEHIDQAIVATDITSADAAVAAAAAEESGSPLILAEDGDLSDGDIEALLQAGVESVIIIGGPAVVRADAEAKLEGRGLRAVRLWGLERTGTAIEAARHFWHGGASCAVLVEDTANAAADATLQIEAAALAAQDRCVLIPMPAGRVPAEVIQLLSELGVGRVRAILLGPDGGSIRNDLREYQAEIIVGKNGLETKLKAEIPIKARQAGTKPKLVIAAAPMWPHGLSAAAIPNERSVVKIVSTVNESLELAGFITSNSITDIVIVGEPGLASEIDNAFEDRGINVTKVVGRRASEITRFLVLKDRALWSERREAAAERMGSDEFRTSAAEKISSFLDRAEKAVADAELQLIDLKSRLDASGTERPAIARAISDLEGRISEAKASIAEARSKLSSGDVKGALALWAKLHSSLRLSAWLHRAQMLEHFADRLKGEGEDLAGSAADVAERFMGFRRTLFALKSSCPDSTIVERIFLKASSLREAYAQAVEAGQRKRAAEIIGEARELALIAHRAAQLCIRQSRLGAELQDLLERRQVFGHEHLSRVAPGAEDVVKAVDEIQTEMVSLEIQGTEAINVTQEGTGLVSRVFLCDDATFDICDAEISGTIVEQTLDIVAEIRGPACTGGKAQLSCTIVVTNPYGNRTGFIQDRTTDCKDTVLCAFSFNSENEPGDYLIEFSIADKVSGKAGSGSIAVTVPS